MPTLADQIAPKPQEPSGLGGWLASIGDEMAGAFARYGRRSGAQRDASLALMSQASAPGTDPIMGAGQKLLGLAGLVTHPLAFFPTREEWDQRLQAAGNDSRIGRSIGGFLSDLPSLIDPQMAAGGAALAAAPIIGKMAYNPANAGRAAALRLKIEPLESSLKKALKGKDTEQAAKLREKLKAIRAEIDTLDPVPVWQYNEMVKREGGQ